MRLIVLFFVAFCLVAPFVGAQAQTVLEQMQKDMPEFEAMPDAAFEEMTEAIAETPQGIAALAFEIRLPKEKWQKSKSSMLGDFSLNRKVLTEVAKYFGPTNFYGLRTSFVVEAVSLDYALTAEQWLAIYMVKNGYASQGFTTYSEDRAESVYLFVERSESFIVRSVAIRNGNMMIFARYIIPEDQWEDQRALQQKVIQSFKITNPREASAEELVSFQFLDIAQLSYPVSWELKPNELRSIDRMNVDLYHVDERATEYKSIRAFRGKMNINLVSSYIVDDLSQEIKAFEKSAAGEHLMLMGELDDVPQWIYDDHVSFAKTQAFQASRKSKAEDMDFEVWTSLLSIEDYYYFVSLITPSREDNYPEWVRNTQTYRLVMKNLKPL